MNTLFPLDYSFPPGFSYYPDFITAEEERALLHFISEFELHSFQFQGYEAKRRVASFGFDWNFERRELSKGKDIPSQFLPLVNKVANKLNFRPEQMAELLLTEYPEGSVINWHRDAPPFEVIAGVSLLSDCIFRLRPHQKEKQNRKSIISFPVQRRSLYVISGESRSEWQHSTAPVKSSRYSITLRTLA